MKIVILAAGRGKRMKDLTDEIPKPLLKYEGQTLLEHKLNNLPENISEVIIVIGYLGDKIKEAVGENHNGLPIRYVIQEEALGTAHALWQCKDFLDEPFIVLMSDDLYSKTDLQNLAKEDSWTILTYPGEKTDKAGKIVTDQNNHLVQIYEDFEGTSDYNLLYTGACLLTKDFFNKEMVSLSNGEFGLPQTFCQFVKERPIKVIKTADWVRITAPEDLK